MEPAKPVFEVELLSRYLKAFGVVFLIIAILEFLSEIQLEEIFQAIIHPIKHGSSTLKILGFVKELIIVFIFLFLSNGLKKGERWIYFLCLFIFCYNILSALIEVIFNFSFQSIDSLSSIFILATNIYFLYLLEFEKHYFFKKESLSSLFKKPAFIIFIIGIVYIIIFPIVEEFISYLYYKNLFYNKEFWFPNNFFEKPLDYKNIF